MLFDDPLIKAYFLVVAGILGLVMGSFINCWAWRSTHGESVLKGRSHCATCDHPLAVRDLVPVFSWLFSGGKCRYCGQKVSARYPATEIVCAVVFVAITAVYGLTVETVELLAFSGVLLFLSLTDLDEYIIPNGCIITAIVVRLAYLAYAFAMGDLTGGDIAFYLGSGFGMGIVLVIVVIVADKVLGRESMGGGDLKLYFVAGLYFGWQQGLFLVIVSCIIGLAVALLAPPRPIPEDMQPQLAVKNEEGDASGKDTDGEDDASSKGASTEDEPVDAHPIAHRMIPFGPSIAAACVITMFAGKPFISWYLSLLSF